MPHFAIQRAERGVYNIAEDTGFVSIAKARRELGWDPDYRLEARKMLKARGYARSELTAVEASPLSKNIVLVSVSRVRYKKDGSQLERLGATYAFRKIDNGWKIVTATVPTRTSFCA